MARPNDAFDDLFAGLDVAPTWGTSVLDCYSKIERQLVAKGFPATSPWWLTTIKKFYDSGKFQLVLRVGRRGGKSSTLSRLVVAEALAGDHKIQPGDTGVVGILSVDRKEAAKRLKTIREILDALSVSYEQRGEQIELKDRPIAFDVVTATIRGVVGSTWIAAFCDETSRWRDADTGANPADDVLSSLRPTLTTMPNAKLILSSSPLGLTDAHARAFDAGDTEQQMVAYAPSWVANPTITEARTREVEKSERKWRREFLAIPQGPIAAVFDGDLIDRATKPVEVLAAAPPVMSTDASRGTDNFCWAPCGWSWANGKAKFHVRDIGYVENGGNTGGAVREIAAKARKVKATIIVGDQYEAGAMAVLYSNEDFSFMEQKWTVASKREAVDRLERLFRDDEIILPSNETLRRQLIEWSEKTSRSGELTYSGSGAHDDHVAVILTALMADMKRQVTMVERPTGDSPVTGTKEYYDAMEDYLEEKRLRAVSRKHREDDYGIDE